MNYKELLFNFLKDDLNREYSVPILKKLLQANFKKGKGKYIITIKNKGERKEIQPNEIEENFEEILEFIVKKSLIEGYNAIAIPFIISVNQAPNFYVFEEKPKEEELWWWLYNLITGVHYKEFVLNITNVTDEIAREFRNYLINQNFLIFEEENSGLNLKEMLSKIEAPKNITLKEFIFGFILLSYFAKFLKSWEEREKFSKHIGEKIPEITDETSLFIFVLSRQKKKVYIFPKIKRVLSYWFDEYSGYEVPIVSRFFFSFFISDKKYKKQSEDLLNKILYYFLQNYVNGEILSRLIELKVSYELREKGKRIKSIKNAFQFFSKL